MEGFIGEITVPFLLGAACIILGCFTAKGKAIAQLFLRRKKISEKNLIPFGKRYGLAFIIFGITIILFGVMVFLSVLYDNWDFMRIGKGIGFGGMTALFIISGNAITKYGEQNRINS